jgi:hypothetical protein
MNTIIDSTKAYRSNLATSQQLSQFSLPSSIKLLPLLTLSLLKDDFTQQQQQQQQYFGLYPEYEGRY